MSPKRPLISLLMATCMWSVTCSSPPSSSFGGTPGGRNFQKGKGICKVGLSQVCPAGYECRKEQIIRTRRRPTCRAPEIRSEVFTRTDEWKTATFGIGVLAFNFSNYYTENSVFLLEIIPRFTGPPDGASESSVKYGLFAWSYDLLREDFGRFQIPWTLEDVVHLSDDLVLSLNRVGPTSPNADYQAVYELLLWKREQGVLKIAVQAGNIKR